MKQRPWLIIGTSIGAMIGFAIGGSRTEDFAWQPIQYVVGGAIAGLFVGLLLDTLGDTRPPTV